MFDDQNGGSHNITIGSVFVLLKQTDFDICLFRGKVHL